MSEWICRDVGLVINELRDRFSQALSLLEDEEGEEMNRDIEMQIKGLNMAYDILDDVADCWMTDNPPQRILAKVKGEEDDE